MLDLSAYGPGRSATGLEEGLPALSRSARAFVRHRPREARLAVTAALEAAAAQCEAEEAGAGPDVPERLRPFIVRRAVGDEIVGVSEAAARLEVSRTTVYDWVKRNTLLAWRSTKRGLRIPAAQILGSGRVVPGLADVVEIVGDPELAWAFLTQERDYHLDIRWRSVLASQDASSCLVDTPSLLRG